MLWSSTDYELVILALRTCTCLQAKIYQHVSFAVFHSLLITYFWNVPTLNTIRQRFFRVSSFKDLFDSIDKQIIIDFIKETHFYAVV